MKIGFVTVCALVVFLDIILTTILVLLVINL